MRKNPWKKLSSKISYKNPYYHVREDKVITPNGKKGQYNVVVRKPAVFIVAITDSKEIYLIGKYRYTTQMYSLEIPAGGADGQNPLTAAKRELKEETGLVAKKWKNLGTIQIANGIMDAKGIIYIAAGLRQTNENKQKEEGIQELLAIPFAKALKMIKNGEITDSETIAILSMAALEINLLRLDTPS